MKLSTLQEIADWCEGSLCQGAPDLRVNRVQIDSRTLLEGDFFVALRGPRFDGHDFIPSLLEKGAVAAMVRRGGYHEVDKLGLIEVKDTLVGLQKLAQNYRNCLPVQTIGVTGSSGKTSTKELIAAVLRRRFRIKATEGNLNNHIGVPLTLLQMEEKDEFGVVEMGMNHPGEIAPLAKITAPKIGVITCIGTAHLEFFRDQEGIALEKSELIRALPQDGVAILNNGDEWSHHMVKHTSARVVWVGLNDDCKFYARNMVMTPKGITFEICHGSEHALVNIPVRNRVMVSNALLAAAVGHECGLGLEDIVAGLESVKLPGARMQVLEKDGVCFINDAYNANPDSMQAALIALKEYSENKRSIAVLGSMGELGHHADALHRQVGRIAAEQKIEYLIAVGPNANALRQGALEGGLNSNQMAIALDADEAWQLLNEFLLPGDIVLIKGSHFMGLEKIAEHWLGKEKF